MATQQNLLVRCIFFNERSTSYCCSAAGFGRGWPFTLTWPVLLFSSFFFKHAVLCRVLSQLTGLHLVCPSPTLYMYNAHVCIGL